MSTSVASERDLRTLAGIVSDDRADLPAVGLPLSLLADLMGQIRCDFVSFEGLDSGQPALWFWQEIPIPVDDGTEQAWCEGWGEQDADAMAVDLSVHLGPCWAHQA